MQPMDSRGSSGTLIRGGRVITMDPALGDLDDADVLITDGTIRAVGPAVDPPSGVEIIDAHHMIVSPGFVDTHRHVWQTQLRTLATNWTLFDYTCRMRFGYSCHVGLGRYDRGDRLVERLADANLLGPDVLLVHGAALTDHELALVAASGAGISGTPETELQMGMGRPVTFRARDAGVRTGLGIDIVSNYAGDMFGQMRLQLQAERGFRHEAATGAPRTLDLTAREVLELATIGGARALGLEDRIGSLSPGKQADVMLTRCDAINMVPVHDPVGALVLNATTHDVDTVLVAGRPVKRHGALVGIDWPALAEQLRASSAQITAGFAQAPLDRIEPLIAAAMLGSEA